MNIQKRVAAIHDISGFGRCSLTVALPILSSMGIETAAMPTALLSSHTGVEGYTYKDLTDEMPLFLNHWKKLSLEFDSIYSGFLGSHKQIDIVSDFIDNFKNEDTIVLVDPAMADHGKMYPTFDRAFSKEMTKLCKKADVIVPNMTEAVFMLGMEYIEGPYTKQYIEGILKSLAELGPSSIVLTGVCFKGDELGAASFDAKTNTIQYSFSPYIDSYYHGTGDVFASVLLASILNGFTLSKSVEIAVDFIYNCLLRSGKAETNPCWGV
ncbi:MAG: pyridoxamine kinase, partial [Oscillospiraceae bacterium]